MASSTVENYLKQLYLQQQQTRRKLVSMGRLASAMNVVPGTVTTMVKALAESGLVSYEPRGGVRLTSQGEQLALHVLRRHRLLELFLVKVLGLDWSAVHAEAEELEHAISDLVLARIDAVLGHPSVDPHGDPIPPQTGRPGPVRRLASLATCKIGKPMRIARIVDQDPRFLQFLQSRGLMPGATVEVEDRQTAADAVQVRPRRGDAVTLGTAAAAKVLVEAL